MSRPYTGTVHQFGTFMSENLRNTSLQFSPRVQKRSQFRPPTQQRNEFHPYTEVKANWIRRTEIKPIWITHKKNVNFRADPKKKWFSASIQVTSQFLPPTQQLNHFHPYTEINSTSTPTLRSSQFQPASQKSCQFPCAHWSKLFSTRIQKRQSWLRHKISQFRSSLWNQVNFYPPHNTKLNSTPTLESSQFRSPL